MNKNTKAILCTIIAAQKPNRIFALWSAWLWAAIVLIDRARPHFRHDKRRDIRGAGERAGHISFALAGRLCNKTISSRKSIKIERRPVLSHWVTGFQPSR